MNYYIKHKIRKVNQKDLHIGKDSGGAEFCFMAQEACGFYNTPTLKNKVDWFEFMFLNDDLIYSEEDIQITFLEFAEIVMKSKKDGNTNIYDKCSEYGDSSHTYYKDKDGFAFDTTEFE